MHPLKIVALVIGALPAATFVLTLYLTDGAPLQPPTARQIAPAAAAVELASSQDAPVELNHQINHKRDGATVISSFESSQPDVPVSP